MPNQITAKRLSLCPCVRMALEDLSISTVSVVNAINGVLAKSKLVDGSFEAGLKDGKTTKGTKEKDPVYKVWESSKAQWTLPVCVVTRFDTWHCMIEKASKYAFIGKIQLPDEFLPWLLKFQSLPNPQAEPAHKEDFAGQPAS